MSSFRYGCETFSWIMSGDKYVGKIPHLLDVIQRAGMSGIETNGGMMGPYFRDPAMMKDALAEHGLELASLSYGGAFQEPKLNEKELAQAERVLEYLAEFPGTRLSIAHGSANRDDLLPRQRNAVACINQVARMAAERGIVSAFHPTSGGYSIFRTAEDYEMLLGGLDTESVGYCPDSGHIVNGHMDIYELFATYGAMIRHVHLKDITADKQWAPMGAGVIDFPRLLRILADFDYDGWIVIEEESDGARSDPDAATLENGEYLRSVLLPLEL